MNEFKTCPAGAELYNQLCDAFELELKRGAVYEAERQAAWRAWTCGDAVEIHSRDICHIEEVLMDFHSKHQGIGCGPTDSLHCLRARRKRERQYGHR